MAAVFEITITITKFVDKGFPGFVECQLVDAMGQSHAIIEKVPIVTTEDLWLDSSYPREGSFRCEVVKNWEDDRGRNLCQIDTSRPWSIESTEGKTEFVVLASQLRSL